METIKIGIITASDKGAAGERQDGSAAVIRELVERNGCAVKEYRILPDERKQLADEMIRQQEAGVDIIFTTGGTGLSPRDVTPEATLDAAEKLVPGIPEAMRANSLKITDRAMLSRAQAGVRKQTLIVNLPGSPKAVKECLEVFLPCMEHAVQTLKGSAECARKD